jgi:hypothetical protein
MLPVEQKLKERFLRKIAAEFQRFEGMNTS